MMENDSFIVSVLTSVAKRSNNFYCSASFSLNKVVLEVVEGCYKFVNEVVFHLEKAMQPKYNSVWFLINLYPANTLLPNLFGLFDG